jgi:hypothetical protein
MQRNVFINIRKTKFSVQFPCESYVGVTFLCAFSEMKPHIWPDTGLELQTRKKKSNEKIQQNQINNSQMSLSMLHAFQQCSWRVTQLGYLFFFLR